MGVTLTAELTLRGNLSSNTIMDAQLDAYLANCDGGGCILLGVFGVNIPCSVELSAEGNY